MSYTPKNNDKFKEDDKTPSMEKNLQIKERRQRFQCKCHWTQEKETLQNELQQIKISFNKMKDEKQFAFLKSNKYEKDCKLFQKILQKSNMVNQTQNSFFFRVQCDQSKKLQLQKIQQQNQQIKDLENQIKTIKKTFVFTKIKELEIENENYVKQIQKLNELAQQINQQNYQKINQSKNSKFFEQEFNRQSNIIKQQESQIQILKEKNLIEQSLNMELQQQLKNKQDRVNVLQKQVLARDFKPINKLIIRTPKTMNKIQSSKQKTEKSENYRKQHLSIKEQCLQSHLDKIKNNEISQSFKNLQNVFEQYGYQIINQLNIKIQIWTQSITPFEFGAYKSKQLSQFIFGDAIEEETTKIEEFIKKQLEDNLYNQQKKQIKSQLCELIQSNLGFINKIFAMEGEMNINQIQQVFQQCGLALQSNQLLYIQQKLKNNCSIKSLQQLIYKKFLTQFSKQSQQVKDNDHNLDPQINNLENNHQLRYSIDLKKQYKNQ